MNEFDFIENQTAWYQHEPRTVEENANAKVLWNFAVQTDHALQHNKPDIIVNNKTNNKALIIDVAVPNDNNVCRKRLDKIRAYSNLAVEIKTLWRLTKVDVVPVIVGATGVMHSGFDNDIEKVDLKRMKFDKFQAQKITLLGTSHIVQSFSQIA